MLSNIALLAVVPFLTYTAEAAGNSSLSSILKSHAHEFSPNTTIHLAGSPGFFNVTERWNTFEPPTFKGAISPATEEDVVKAINLASKYNIPFLGTGGRHGYTTTLEALQNGLEIDLSQLNSITVDKSAETLTIGPGVTIGDIFEPLSAAGLEMQTGSCPCPSLIGVTLGGGIGRYQGVYGLSIDALMSARIVTANGSLYEVSNDKNSDLFWAIRGAGANFGLITSATYKAHPSPDGGNNFVVDFMVTPEQVPSFFETVQSMQPLPAELAAELAVLYNTTVNKSQVSVEWTYKGSEKQGRKALQPMFNLNLTVTRLAPDVKWKNLINSAFGGGLIKATCQANITRAIYGANVQTYSASTLTTSFDKMQNFFAQYPGGRGSLLQYELFPNQAMAAVPSNSTAYPWRQATGYLNFNLLFEPNDTTTENAAVSLGKEIRADIARTSGYPGAGLKVFVNYAHGDEGLNNIYGKGKLGRLSTLKQEYDPNHIFSFNNGIPSHSS